MATLMKNPMMTDLPLVMASGTFKSLNSMSENQIEQFLGYLVRFTCQKYNLSPFVNPSWWTENVVYHPEFSYSRVPLPYTRNKSVKLRRLIRLCYISYNCKDLLSLSDKMAALHALSYKFVRNNDGTVTVMQVSSRTPIVMIPASNLDYDLDVSSGQIQRELTIIPLSPLRKSLIAYDTKTRPVITNDDEANNCIVIEDSSSDDDVEIVSYEKGAFPPTPPKRRFPPGIRPGPACSKIKRRLDESSLPASAPSPNQQQQYLAQNVVKKTSTVPPTTHQKISAANCSAHPQVGTARHHKDQLTPLQTQIRPYINVTRSPGTVPKPLQTSTNPQNAAKRFLQVRNTRPQRHQTFTFVDIDLTIDFDEDDVPEKKAQLPSELSQNSFLSSFNLLGKGCNPPEKKNAPIMVKKTNRLNMNYFSIDMVPHMVQRGLLPKSCLFSANEMEKRKAYIERHTRRDFELSRISVNVKNSAAVAAVVRKCFVKVKRLNSADMRKWRKIRQT